MRLYIAISLLAILLIASCGTPKAPDSTITWWQFWTDTQIRPVITEIIAEFEAENPEWNVEIIDLTWADGHDKIAVALSAKSGPDIIELGSDWIAEFATTGHLADISGAVADIKNQYLMWQPVTIDGAVYGFPWILGTRVLFANTDLLEQAGFDSTWSPRTWSDLLEAAAEINEIDRDTYGFASNAAEKHRLYKKFLPFLWSAGGQVLSDDGATAMLDSKQAHTALEYYIALCRTGITDTQRRLEDAFLDSRIGFVISGDWLLKRLTNEKPGFPFATFIIPGPNGPEGSVSFAGGEYLVVNERSDKKDAAVALIKHICSPANQLKFCKANQTANPSSIDAARDPFFTSNPHFLTFASQINSARMTPSHPQWVYIEDRLEKAIEAALFGAKTPKSALMEANIQIQEILDR